MMTVDMNKWNNSRHLTNAKLGKNQLRFRRCKINCIRINLSYICAIMLLVQFVGCHTYIIKEDESFLHPPFYHGHTDIEDLFAHLAKTFPDNAKLEIIGTSLEGRSLTVLRIGQNMQHRNLLTPLVKYIANMHGDETVGRQLMIYLCQYLLYNYSNNVLIQTIINTTDIYLMPSMNPDGFARSQEGNCESLPNYVGRTNAAGVDLNRDFPDRLESQQQIQARSRKRQPETAALVEWMVSKPFVLSANFHGGALVASYPYDNSIAHRECCQESLTPDDRVFKLMAHTYADHHPIMRSGHNCNDTFANGITNGAKWYELNGGMQDFNYAFTNCFEVTIELSCCKYPPASTLADEWQRNKRSLLELLKLSHIGVKGVVKDLNGYPIHDATIVVSGLEDKSIRTTKRGEYWRLLTPGLYNIQAMAFGYRASEPQQVHVTNESPIAQRLDFVLMPIITTYDGDYHKIKVERDYTTGDIEKNGGFLTTTTFEHHNFTAMENFLRDLADSYPSITRLYSIGKSVQNRDLWVMELFSQPGQHVPGVPEFKYVANMHGNEVVGKEMLLLLTKYICERYMYDNRITRLVNSTRMHFLYSMNPDGYEMARQNDKTDSLGRENANHVDLNRNFPDQYGTDRRNRMAEPEVMAVMNWTMSIPFVLSANLHGGALVANYPYDDNSNDFNDPITHIRDSTVERKVNPTDDNDLFKHLAKVYAQAHPTMHLGKPCPQFQHEIFRGGIVNGAQWYSVTGGMQDWNYVAAGVMEVTLELGCDKFPPSTELLNYWLDNREPLILFVEQAHYGVHGFIRSSIGNSISGAAITMDNTRHTVHSAAYGDYWRLSLPGRHNLAVLADGYSPQKEVIEISESERSMRLDLTLMRDDDQHWASANDYRIIENVVHTRYHTNAEIRERLADFEVQHANITTFEYADNEFGYFYNTIKMTSDIGAPEENKFKILIFGSFFDTTSPLAREITLNLVRHIIEGYKLKEPRILTLLKSSVLYIIPTTENFDMMFNIYNKNNSVCDPVIDDELAQRVLRPETERKRDLLLQFFNKQKFDLMLTFSAGHSDLIYPKDEPIYERFAHYTEDIEFNFSPLQCTASASRSLHRNLTERLTNLLHKIYKIPLFTLGLSCCRMPLQNEIAAVWRKNIDKLKKFLQLINTGATGYIHNNKGLPLREAFIRLINHNVVYNVTKNLARFQIILPEGNYALMISAANYESTVVKVNVKREHISDLGIIILHPYTLITGQSTIEALNPLGSTTTILSGFVLDSANHPIPHAKVSMITPVTQHHVHNFSDSLGAYILRKIPIGDKITLKVEAPHYFESTRMVQVPMDRAAAKGVIFHLKRDEDVLGMPRFIFIILASIGIIFGVIICIFCGQLLMMRRHRNDKPYYNFSLLPQKSRDYFEDDELGDDGETELFTSPIKKGMIMKHYYDNEDDDGNDRDDDDDDDDLRHMIDYQEDYDNSNNNLKKTDTKHGVGEIFMSKKNHF